MGKFSLTNLIMCVSKYQKLNSEDYIRLGLCLPDCQDCATGSPGHLKNDKMVSHSQSVSQSVRSPSQSGQISQVRQEPVWWWSC